MLTTKKLFELGFSLIREDNNWYLKKGVLCLYPMNGCWAVGNSLDNLAYAPPKTIFLLSNLEELNSFCKANKIKL